MTRSRVFIERSRSDQNRAIESREDNAPALARTQSRKETEFFELNAGYFFASVFLTALGVVMMLPSSWNSLRTTPRIANRCVIDGAWARAQAPCVAKQMQLSTSDGA